MDEEAKTLTVGDRESGYLMEFREDGVFLTVYPNTTGENLFELSDLQQILTDYGVEDYNILEMAKTVRSAKGMPVRIASHFASSAGGGAEAEVDDPSQRKAGLIVDVSRDKMQASIRYDTTKGTVLPTKQEVLDALEAKGVTTGIDEKAIEEGIRSLNTFVAAQGHPPVHGENAHIERKYDLSIKGRPAVNEYNRVDYKNLNLFILVKKGDLIAERIPQTEGVEGINVYGNPVAAHNGRPIPMPKGKNVEVREENKLYALIDGQIDDQKSRINVNPHLLLHSGVGVGTGNIDFTGSVEIQGNVEQGFVVKATGDIQVKGLVSGNVTGRNVFVGGGISGLNAGRVVAEEDVHAAYVENATVEAGRDIQINDVVLHSTLKAGKRIYVEQNKGTIMGGNIAAGEEIRAKVFGNPAFVVTRLSVGINPSLQRKYQEACKQYKEDKHRLQQIDAMLNTLSKIDTSKLPPHRIEQINKLTYSRFPLAGRIQRTEKSIKQLEEELSKMKHGKIYISDRMYPGCRVSVNSILMNVQSEIQHSVLQVKEDHVEVGPF